ncbi:solute carrier family 25 protein [Talaromyces proteolyticus]|uniref:Solute carrier family 25 protein n=1 Tax=Talaromyces proteolyticus TaxID=1131652 RepID=A0AAD4KV06_9EURO|nr:solute carrier family 25 protein [Talaromyces proteolyticus]KAH8701727.1 solute carrier family 25 protein [Talaromyces proteolyticus]
MSSDFWAGYISGAAGILIGNPLDVIKVRLQAGGSPNELSSSPSSLSPARNDKFQVATSFARGAAAPILGYGALNALLFVAYNRSLKVLDPSISDPTNLDQVSLAKIWLAGATGGMASWVVSSPTELIKCRAQLSRDRNISSWSIAKEIVQTSGLRGLYFGGLITSFRDSVGFGFYFWSYELCKRNILSSHEGAGHQEALKVLICGGIAGIATWTSIFPLDVLKTRLQAQPLHTIAIEQASEIQPLVRQSSSSSTRSPLSSLEIARQAYRAEGLQVFFRGLGTCNIRAFIVNAIQWAVYEWLMKELSKH